MKISKFILFSTALVTLTACSTLTLDKERAAERRKQDLCGEIDTRNLPHCTGTGADLSDITPEMRQELENAEISKDVTETPEEGENHP